MRLAEKCDERRGGEGGYKSLTMSFLEVVYGFRVSFLSLCIFLGYEFDVMADIVSDHSLEYVCV